MSDSSTLQPELPTGEGPNQESLPADANAQSDDLFGEDPSEATESTQVKSAPSASEELQPSDTITSKPVETQQTSNAAPLTDPSSGITPVAQYVPSDAKLDQPVVSPDEPLAVSESTLDKEDTQMSDAPAPELATQESTSEAADSARPSKSEPQLSEAIQSSNPVDSAASVPTPPEEKPDLPNGKIDESRVEAGNDQVVPKSEEASSAPTQGIATPQIVAPVDQKMMDTPSSGTVRPRDEADGDDEPVAKRARTEDSGPEAPAESKQSEAQVQQDAAQPVAQPIVKPEPTSTNGDKAHAPAPASTAVPAAVPATVPAPPSNTVHFSSEPMKPSQKAVLLEKMKNTKKVKSAAFFLRPVNPVAENIPHYTTIIKKPMDLSTMERKLKADEYASVDDFVADFELMITNTITFNGPQHPVAVSGQNLRAYFLKQMQTVPTGSSANAPPPKQKKSSPKPSSARRESRAPAVPGAARSPVDTASTYALLPGGTPMIRRDSSPAGGRPKRAVIAPQRDLPYSSQKPKRKESQMGLKFCDYILQEFKKTKNLRITSAFLVPVDPVALNIPTYFHVVKRPMDLQTMTNKLKAGQYGTASEFKDDFITMIDNSLRFNPPDNPVHLQGKELRAAFDREWSKKDLWIKKNAPPSQRPSPTSDVESDGEESEADEEDGDVDSNEATIAILRQQLVTMQNTIATITGAKPPKSKKKKTSSGVTKPAKKNSVSSAPKATIKAKPKKQRIVTYEEKQEISNATENMNDEQITKLTNIITENVAKYKDMEAEDVELEIDDLPNDVQHKLLRYVRSIFPPKPVSDDGNAVDDDYEPERPAARTGKKKHKPMKKHEQEARIKELQEQMSRLNGGLQGVQKAAAPVAKARPDSSDEEDSESSEEE